MQRNPVPCTVPKLRSGAPAGQGARAVRCGGTSAWAERAYAAPDGKIAD
jgi:hypothetical protein